ncbi:MAG TPA: chemotaxis protein CheW [Gemmatimonadales bacterium]
MRGRVSRGPKGLGTAPLPGGQLSDTSVELLVFVLATDRFAVRARRVREVVRAVTVAALPDAPPVVEGAINYRGRIVPVIDTRLRVGWPSRPLDPSQHFIVADAGPRRVVLRVDQVVDLVAVAEDVIESAARATPGARYTEGIARLPDGLIVIHDLERFLSLDEGQEVDAAVRAVGGASATGGVR